MTDHVPAMSPEDVQRMTDEVTERVNGEADAEYVWRDAVAESKHWLWRNRRPLMPWGAAAGTWVAGAGAVALDGPASLLPLSVGAGAAIAAYSYAHSRTTRWQRFYAAACAACSIAWQSLAQINDAAAGAWGVALVSGFATLALPYWVRVAESDPDTQAEIDSGLMFTPEPEPEPQPDVPSLDSRLVEWGEFVKVGTPDADINEITAEAAGIGNIGWRVRVWQDKPGHWSAVAQAKDKIASTYDQPDSHIYVEPVIGGSARVAEVTVITEEILHKGLTWTKPGLDPQRGSFPVMLAADGTVAHFQLWRPGIGAKHALISGTTGSGKSALFDLIFTEIAYCPFYVPWLIDGGDGSSSPAWTRSRAVPHVALTQGDAHKLLNYAMKVMRHRKRALNHVRWTDDKGVERIGVSQIDPCPQMPGIAIMVDEAHNLLTVDPQIKQMMEFLGKEGRKVAMNLILATQVPSAEQLGNSTVLRNMLKSGTVIGLRTTESTAANMASSGRGLPEPLHQLPEQFWQDGPSTEGLGYMLNAPRLIRSRTLYQPRAHEWAAGGELTELEPTLSAIELPVFGDDGGSADDASRESVSENPTDAEALQTVLDTLLSGVPKDVFSLIRATGLPASQVRGALKMIG